MAWLARLLASLALTALAWMPLRGVGLILVAPLLGWLWAAPLAHMAAHGWSALRRHARHIEGATHAWRGHPLRVLPDPTTPHHWVMAADLRRAGLALPPDDTLKVRWPVVHWRLQRGPGPPGLSLRADALAASLRRSSQPDSLRLARWLDAVVLRRHAARSRVPDGPSPQPDETPAPPPA